MSPAGASPESAIEASLTTAQQSSTVGILGSQRFTDTLSWPSIGMVHIIVRWDFSLPAVLSAPSTGPVARETRCMFVSQLGIQESGIALEGTG